MRNQAGSNWCYAYFTADMYSHRLAKTAAGRELLQNQMISPMSFLINPPDKEKNGATSENTSFTELTVVEIIQQFYPLESTTENSLYALKVSFQVIFLEQVRMKG